MNMRFSRLHNLKKIDENSFSGNVPGSGELIHISREMDDWYIILHVKVDGKTYSYRPATSDDKEQFNSVMWSLKRIDLEEISQKDFAAFKNFHEFLNGVDKSK